MPKDLKDLSPLISPSAACIYASGVNFKTGIPIQKPDRDYAPLGLRLLKAMGLLTTIDLDTFKWTQDFDTASLSVAAEDHSYSAMRQWEAEHLGALDGSGTLGNIAQNFVDHNWGYPLGSTGAAFQPPQGSQAASPSEAAPAAASSIGAAAASSNGSSVAEP